MNVIQTFCRQVRSRSAEHRQAVQRLDGLPGSVVSILRQELDSMVRVVFLLAQKDREYRKALVEASVAGKKWTQNGSRKNVTDREMVELANGLQGWTESVYRFGCGFIHLSSLHDYHARDALRQLDEQERQAVLAHLRYYHGDPKQAEPTFEDVVPLLPRVFEKIADNLECYLKELERDGDIEDERPPNRALQTDARVGRSAPSRARR
jgi:hypothetical protein